MFRDRWTAPCIILFDAVIDMIFAHRFGRPRHGSYHGPICFQGLQAIRCPAGLAFDIEKQTCDWKAAVDNCEAKTKEKKVKPLLFTDEPICQENYLACGDGNCIERGLFCNGDKDCNDGSDENACGESVREGGSLYSTGGLWWTRTWVGLATILIIPLSAWFYLGIWEFGRIGWLTGQGGGTLKIRVNQYKIFHQV